MDSLKEFHHLKIELKDVISSTDNFISTKLIGRGGFGQVYKGELSHREARRTVAFKRLDRRLGQGNIEFWKEIMMLSKLKHENLISLLHFCIEGDERILVYEYASRGSLDRYLSDASLRWIQRLKICVEAARAITYLHDPKESLQRVIHRDIKSSNILVDENWAAKVSDFGLSKIALANQPQSYLVSNAVGTIGYCDPLYHETGFLSKESDVYSFGVVLLEVICGKLCCEYQNNQLTCLFVPIWKKSIEENKVDDIIFHDLKGQMDGDALMIFSTITYRCLKRDHKERPTMVEVVNELEAALEQQLIYDRVIQESLITSYDADSDQLMLKAEIVKITVEGGLVDLKGVEKFIQLMKAESAEKKLDVASRIMLVNVLSFTRKFDCLRQFVQLRGLNILEKWLQEFHEGKIDESGDEFLLALLSALDKLPVNHRALKTCNVGKSVNHLRSHKNSQIQRKARSLVDTWKKRVGAEMNFIREIGATKKTRSSIELWPVEL